MKVKYNKETPSAPSPYTSEEHRTGRSHIVDTLSHFARSWHHASSGWGAGATTLRVATLALVHSTAEYCAPVWCRSAHTRLIDPTIHQWRLSNCDRMPASYTSGQPSNPRRHPTCWASSQWSHTVSRTSCHGAWTSAPVSAHPPIELECTAPQIETPICTRHTTTHQFIWQ